MADSHAYEERFRKLKEADTQQRKVETLKQHDEQLKRRRKVDK